MHEWCSIQWECNKLKNYTFSMHINRNENYSCWVHKYFEHVQNVCTDLLKPHAWEEHCSNRLPLSLSLLEWPGITRNDHLNKLELSIRPHLAVDSAQWDWGIKTMVTTNIIYCTSENVIILIYTIHTLVSWTKLNLVIKYPPENNISN